MIEVQCTSCHTRYRIDEQVLPEGLPTFKCSRCGHVFTFEPRQSRLDSAIENVAPKAKAAGRVTGESSARGERVPESRELLSGLVGRMSRTEGPSSPQTSMAASDSDMSDQSRAEAGPSNLQSGPIETEEPAHRTSESESAPSDTSHAPRPEPNPAVMKASPRSIVSPQPSAKQAEKFYSRLLTGQDPNGPSGENLAFDFADEEQMSDQARLTRQKRGEDLATVPSDSDSKKWEVGDDESGTSEAVSRDDEPFAEEELVGPRRRQRRTSVTEPEFTDDTGFLDEEEASVYNRAVTHSARFFLLLMFVVGAGFGFLTLLIHSAPSGSSAALSYLPLVGDRFVIAATPAKLVALRDVAAGYQRSKEGRNALVISGTAENVGTASLRIVQLTAVLRDSQRRSLSSETVYCGNSVSAGMIGQMTPHEIEFFQKLEPAATFTLEPMGSCRFVAVFINPPSSVHTYEVSVSQAVPGPTLNAGEPAS
jgi:predicted Zn finger-like uncharacterized protein